jgi:NADH dehydrogenase
VINKRLRGEPLSAFKYSDRGSLISLADYDTFGLLYKNVKLQGLIARWAYRALHKRHLQALHGSFKVALDSLVHAVTRRTEPRIKLH